MVYVLQEKRLQGLGLTDLGECNSVNIFEKNPIYVLIKDCDKFTFNS